MLKLRKNKKGFTLVELIVVIAIMAVLAGTVAGVTVAQLNKQTNNTAKTEAQTLASDFKNFMIDYTLPAGTGTDGKTPPTLPGTNTAFTMPGSEEWNSGDGINTVGELTYAVYEFIAENKLSTDALSIVNNNNSTGKVAGEHKFYAYIYKSNADGTANEKGSEVSVMFYCKHKGTNANQQPKAIYTYSDTLTDN